MATGPQGTGGGSASDLDAAMVAKLLPFLEESVMVVREGWEVVANLTSPAGMTGRPKQVGDHAMTYLHPDDALRLFEAGSEAFRTEPGWSGATAARMQLPDGSFQRYDIAIHNCLDDPVVRGMVVCTRPWTGTIGPLIPEMEPAIGAALLVEHLPIGVAVLSPQGQPLFANEIAADLFDTDVTTLCAGPLVDAVHSADRMLVSAAIARLARRAGRQAFTLSEPHGDRLLELSFVSRAGRGGLEVQLVVLTVSDATHRHEREQQLEHRANHDLLTGLANRAWLLDHLHERLKAGEDVVVAFVDLDRFKAVNDRLGHVAGDTVLAAVAEGLESCLHPDECVARVGGDEFVVVAPAMEADGRADLSQRIHLAVATVPVARRERVGVSVGLATSTTDDQPWDLLRRADTAMYAQKGRSSSSTPTARLEQVAGPPLSPTGPADPVTTS